MDLFGKSFASTMRRETKMHSHPEGQFTFVSAGLISLETNAGIWVVPRGRLAWIPPRLRHASRSRGPVEGWLVLAAPSYAKHLPRVVGVLEASALLVAALERVRASPKGPLADVLARLVRIEVESTRSAELGLPLPASSAMRRWAGSFLEAPSIALSLDEAARANAMSRRSFTRRFEAETGESFSRWKRRVVVHHAMDRLAQGASVSTIAYDVGYESPSAFIAMFRSLRGLSPRRFVSR